MVLVLFVLFIWFMILQLLGLSDGQDAVTNFSTFGCMHKLASLPWDKLRIPVIAFQIVTQYISITGLPLPNIYHKFLSWTDVFNLNLGWLLSLGCLTQANFYEKLLITTLGPFAVAAALVVTYATVTTYTSQRMVVPARTARLEKALARHYLVFLAMTFLIYSTVSTTVFQTFACDSVDDSAISMTSYLRADYSIECGTLEHKAYKVYAGFMVIIYPLGIPALYAWLLWSKRHKLSDNNDESSVHMISKHDDNTLRSTRFLWKSYTARMYYWEVIECLRRLLLTGAVVFIAPGTAAQAAVACVLAMFSIVVALYCRPHAETLDGQIYTVGAMIIFLSMFLSLAMKTDVSHETDYSQHVFAVVLVVLNVVMAMTAVVQMVLVGRRAYLSRQSSALDLEKIDHTADNDNNSDSEVVDTVPAAAATVSTDKYDTVEHGVTADNSEQQAGQSDMRF
jgi:multisubunit Na+/H+ antiporter MnhG subunit